jgi:polyphosphate kinase
VLDICLRDRRQAWALASDGVYSQLHPDEGASGSALLGTHATLMELASRRAE